MVSNVTGNWQEPSGNRRCRVCGLRTSKPKGCSPLTPVAKNPPAMLPAALVPPLYHCPMNPHTPLMPSPTACTANLRSAQLCGKGCPQCSLARPQTLVARPTCPHSYLITDSGAWLPHTTLY